MSIDYDRLRELRDGATPGPWEVQVEETSTCGDLIEGLAAWIEADNELVFGRGMEIGEDEELTNLALAALAPDMAAELLRLRDGSSQLLAKKRAAVKRLYSTDQVTAAVFEGMCDELENLLEGDTE